MEVSTLETTNTIDKPIREEIAPNTSSHLFKCATATFNVDPRNTTNKTNALSTALNLRKIQTETIYKSKPREDLGGALSCPTCGSLWMPGVNVTIRLETYNTQRHPKHSFETIQGTEKEKKENEKQYCKTRLSKRARKRQSVKYSKKQEALNHKLTTKLGLDPHYIFSSSKSLQKKQRFIVYGCEMCNVYHIVTDKISNKYPSTSVKSKPISANTQSKIGSTNSVTRHNQLDSNTDRPSNQKIHTYNKPAGGIKKEKSKSKQKNTLQKLLAKQKESKAQQNSSSGFGLLGLMSRK